MRKPSPPLTSPIPALGEGKRGEDGHLGYLLRQAAHLHQTQMARALSDLELTPPQFLVMTMIAAYPGLSNADIARLALITPQTVSVIIANLEKASVITRSPHAIHGRIKHLDLTPHGQVLLQAARQRAHTVDTALVAEMTSEMETAVRQGLVTIARCLS
jgi:DNA-binding MarR family transcriptional regulator